MHDLDCFCIGIKPGIVHRIHFFMKNQERNQILSLYLFRTQADGLWMPTEFEGGTPGAQEGVYFRLQEECCKYRLAKICAIKHITFNDYQWNVNIVRKLQLKENMDRNKHEKTGNTNNGYVEIVTVLPDLWT